MNKLIPGVLLVVALMSVAGCGKKEEPVGKADTTLTPQSGSTSVLNAAGGGAKQKGKSNESTNVNQ